MPYHVIFVKLMSPLFIVTCVKCAFVQPVLENIFQVNQKNIKLYHSKCKDLRFCAITIRQKLVNFIVNNVTVQFAHGAFLLVNMNITKKLTLRKRWKTRKPTYTNIYKNWKNQFYLNIKPLHLTSLIRKLTSRN